jgi:hypothetical protein
MLRCGATASSPRSLSNSRLRRSRSERRVSRRRLSMLGGAWRFSTGAAGFWTTNGSHSTPRKPAPWLPPMLTKFGSTLLVSPISDATYDPTPGCCTVGFGM